ncbi:sugar phosphate isomerase/epimerase family protein [Paenibacillus abyssi]|uniref:Xylose isomerase n=1 Tax=Paenibacillus abyssi TaxID=1340531 RepID=A0A917G0P8_9BACL|nr:sugar phosphate isomerase/epimerase [Paenibacillus abyssi]GGG16762.1 xylose isomerase [Paenibacillus abyssi]
MALNIGCQTYTWQMSYDKYANKLNHILNVIEQAGFSGVEPEVCMLGPYRDNPQQLVDDLAARNLKLGALCLALPWEHPEETAEEIAETEFVFNFLKYFPGTLLALVHLPGKDRSNLAERQQNALKCINEVARRANAQGIECAFHPNSPEGSVFKFKEDYDVMFAGLDTRYVGYAPDTGHIANGGMDAEDVIRANRSIIKHVHFKDITADGKWTSMGQGVINHSAIIQFLAETNYSGWIMVEEESDEAEREPDKYTLQNGKYMAEAVQ